MVRQVAEQVVETLPLWGRTDALPRFADLTFDAAEALIQ